MDTGEGSEEHTPVVHIRVPRRMWAAYGRVVARMGKDRTEALTGHMRKMINQFGDEADRADLQAAEAELLDRRARKGGRPRKITQSRQPESPE